MVFSSIPGYVVDPSNWHQQQNHHQVINGSDSTQLLPPLPPQVGGGSGGGASTTSIRPGSTADRARLAKIAPPETALKCPRCDSTNTKFCYFNNYSLTQPRHFCKTCRRYWTRGGALRNVPVGGGCRRNNKKNKGSRSKSPAAEKHTSLSTTSSSAVIPSHHQIGHQLLQPPNLPNFMNSLQNLRGYSVGNMGLGSTDHMGFQQIGGSNSSAVSVDQWRLQQFPFLNNNFESNSSYPFHQGDQQSIEEAVQQQTGFVEDIAPQSSSRVTQPPVKMEDHNGALNLTRASISIPEHNNNQYFSWTDLSGLGSSSTTHDLL